MTVLLHESEWCCAGVVRQQEDLHHTALALGEQAGVEAHPVHVDELGGQKMTGFEAARLVWCAYLAVIEGSRIKGCSRLQVLKVVPLPPQFEGGGGLQQN